MGFSDQYPPPVSPRRHSYSFHQDTGKEKITLSTILFFPIFSYFPSPKLPAVRPPPPPHRQVMILKSSHPIGSYKTLLPLSQSRRRPPNPPSTLILPHLKQNLQQLCLFWITHPPSPLPFATPKRNPLRNIFPPLVDSINSDPFLEEDFSHHTLPLDICSQTSFLKKFSILSA